jgi:hypothetical protein
MRQIVYVMIMCWIVISLGIFTAAYGVQRAGGLRCFVLVLWEGKPPLGCPQ